MTFEIFQSVGTTSCSNERLNKVVEVGEMDSAVPRSIALEIPSGPLTVLILQVESRWKMSSWEQVRLERLVFGGDELVIGGERVVEDAGEVKHEAKKRFNRVALSWEDLAEWALCVRLSGIR